MKTFYFLSLVCRQTTDASSCRCCRRIISDRTAETVTAELCCRRVQLINSTIRKGLLVMQPICWTHGRRDLPTYVFVLQLRVNKRKISAHVGQQRGSAEGDLVDPYVFTRSAQSISVPHGGTSHFQDLFQLVKFSMARKPLCDQVCVRESNRNAG